MILALRACSARSSTSAQNSSSVWSSSASSRYCASVRLAWASWLLICLPASLDLGLEQVVGHLDVDLSSRASKTASRAWVACSSRASRVNRSAMLARISSMVSNSEASWANSSSASGSSWSLNLGDRHLDVGFLVLQRTADQRRG